MSLALPPLQFKPQLISKIWGGEKLFKNLKKGNGQTKDIGESWEISSVPGNVSIVSEGPFKGKTLTSLIEEFQEILVGKKVWKVSGSEFPLLIKFIDAREDLSIQVHPNDEQALAKHKSLGKTEMWYVFEAEKEAKLIAGWKQNLSKAEYEEILKKGDLEKHLNYEAAEPGSVFYIPAGRVHAIGAGICLAEIQQTSDVTYRIYDFNRRDAQGKTRELHTDQALAVMNLNNEAPYATTYASKKNEVSSVVKSDYFDTKLLWITEKTTRVHNEESFTILICVEGEALVTTKNGELKLSFGQTCLIPAYTKEYTLHPNVESKVLEVRVP